MDRQPLARTVEGENRPTGMPWCAHQGCCVGGLTSQLPTLYERSRCRDARPERRAECGAQADMRVLSTEGLGLSQAACLSRLTRAK